MGIHLPDNANGSEKIGFDEPPSLRALSDKLLLDSMGEESDAARLDSTELCRIDNTIFGTPTSGT
jgi:hypothetical protein